MLARILVCKRNEVGLRSRSSGTRKLGVRSPFSALVSRVLLKHSTLMHIEVLNTGTELLLGNTVNTHAAWFGRELFKLGLRIARHAGYRG